MDSLKLRTMLESIFKSYDRMRNSKEKDIFSVLTTIAEMKKVWNNM